ncbi:ferrous iron transport protein A [Thermosulfidibacter takaii ABI70S6]|uniref:Ferrous iron transport protein A n=1 Tax=Thermosulfidibacter takaii (strain DSM 17441 / JCM 13301 / NBRC 103674 / ABI70S6) TaxID=1298851 RepID=A0A0S3QV94_THET7|nr:FeoA family protein [Thermosulfidibacter takaii]BAT72249.1 ferrous iron transport protein A [Thermosulfidibacter takaii ABI70S6]
MKLSELEVGQEAVVTKIGGDAFLKRRLRDMGIVKGGKVKVEHIAPLGDPIEVVVKGTRLSLRKSEATEIEVELV